MHHSKFCRGWQTWVIQVISSVHSALPVEPQLRTFRCVAAPLGHQPADPRRGPSPCRRTSPSCRSCCGGRKLGARRSRREMVVLSFSQKGICDETRRSDVGRIGSTCQAAARMCDCLDGIYKSTGSTDPNWVAASGNMELQKLIRYSEKIAGWRWTDPQIDWSGVKVLAGQRRVVVWLSEVDSY